MILTLLYLWHEYVAKSLIPYYKLQYEAREAANRLVECWNAEQKHLKNKQWKCQTVKRRF